MITAIHLKHFGKFNDKRFTMAPVTVFTGANEAGKTTLFDALFYALCRPRASKAAGKALKERYGESTEVVLDPPADKTLFDEDEFRSLLAIRSGDIELDLAANTSWMERVKARLFTGGVDPVKLRDRFEKLASASKTLKHNQERNQLENENRKLQERLKALQEQRSQILSGEKSAADEKTGLDVLVQDIDCRTTELKTLEREWELKKKAKELVRLTGILARLALAGKRSARLVSLAGYTAVGLEELDRLLANDKELARNLDLATEKRKEAQNNLAELENKLLEQQLILNKQQKLANKAAEYLQHIGVFRNQQPQKKIVTWNRVLLTVSVVPLAIACILPLLLPGLILKMAGMFGSLLVFVILVLLARKEHTAIDEQKLAAYVQSLKDDWQNQTSSGLNSATLNGLADELSAIRLRCDSFSEKVNAIEEEKVRCSKLVIRLNQELQAMATAREKTTQQISDWLQNHTVKNRDEYLKAMIDYSNLYKEDQAWAGELAALLRSYHLTEPGVFGAHIERQVKELEAAGAAGIECTDVELFRLETLYKTRLRELDNIKQTYSVRNTQAARETGRLSGSLVGIAAEIVGTEKTLGENSQKIAKMEIKREAALLACSIFDELSRDSGNVMADLSGELAARFGKIVPAFRQVELPELKTGALRIMDSTGEKRPLEHLSRGTRDAFLFAARLALAQKSHNGPAILILDEPFYALDRSRIDTALDLVKHFCAESGWQLILLTKDENLVSLVMEKFAGALVHSL